MSRKRFTWILTILIVSSIMIVGCQGTTTTPSEPTSEPVEEEVTPTEAMEEGMDSSDIKMAILLSGTVDDLSWNYQMQQAALKIAEEFDFEVDYSENVPAADTERVVREYAETGYNLIITHSFSYGETLFNVAPDYPDVNFAWPGGIDRTAENIADYDQPFYQAAYIMGIKAAGISESGTFSFLSGFDIPVCHSMFEAFRLGAQKYNPDAEVLYTVVGDWGDVAKAKEAVLAHVDAGADYVASCGFGPTLGAIEAAQDSGIYASSYAGDMSSIAPESVALSMIWDLKPLLRTFVEEIEDGTFQPGKFYSYGVAEGSLRVDVNPELADEVPDDATQMADDVVQQIKDGEFEVPYIPEAEE